MPPWSAWLGPLPFALATSSFAATLASAQTPPPPAERALVYSSYEKETIAEVLASLHLARDPSPEDKTIERVEVVPLEVIEHRDPLPDWVNVFHFTSRHAIIRRELLVREGEAYRQVLVDESIRNLRRLPQLSAILVVTTRGSAPDRVGVVIITKDVWSLRLNWNLQLTPGGVELFEAQPAEWNFLGTHQTLNGHFVYQPAAYTFGLGYIAPRLGTSRVALQATADLMVNRRSGSAEGSLGSLVAGQPLVSALENWSWDASAAWRDYIFRHYTDAQVDRSLGVPYQFRVRQFTTTYELTRSYGWDVKHDLTFAAGVDRREYRADFPGAQPAVVDAFRATYVPLSDTRVGPSFRYRTYTKRYLRVIDFDTLALQEDYQLGHDFVFHVYPSFRALGASRDVLGIETAIQYTVALRDGLLRASFRSVTEPETTRIADASITPTLHLVSPTVLGLGRVVLDATFLYSWRNYLNQREYLGGGDRLRGYPTNFRNGHNVVSYNVELRSRPVEILTCQLAGVAFFDAGDAFDGPSTFAAYQSLGVGLRALFPQLDRLVFRADLGFPLERPFDRNTGGRIAPVAFFISFEQAFPTPTVAPKRVLPTGQ